MAIVISGVNNNDKITASDGTIDLLSGVNYTGILTAPGFTASNNITASSINVGSNIQIGNVGIITATTLVGDVTGNVTGNVNATSNLLLQIGGSEKFRVGSSGQLGIAGANYGTSGQVLTSQGSGSAATWSTITGTTINNNADNRVITGSGTANTLNGESGVTIDGSNILSVLGSGQQQLNVGSTNAGGAAIVLDGDSNGDGSGGDYSLIRHNTDGDLEFYARSTGGATNTIFKQGTSEKVRIHSSGTLQAYNHATSRNGIVQIKQVTSTTRYSGSPASVDLITSSTMTPKTSAPRFLIMIFCPVNTSDDSDAGGGNTNFYFYGRIEYRKNGGSWLECNDQGSTAQQGGYASHIELSPNRTGSNASSDYWSGNRYRTESKTATILATNVGDCGLNGTVEFKLRSYSYGGNFIQIGQPHGNGTDDNYGVQPWGFTVFELAPDSNSYTAY